MISNLFFIFIAEQRFFLWVFAFIWIIYLFMKIIRPNEFYESITRPYVYYRIFHFRISKHFQDFRLLGSLNMLLLGALVLSYLLKETHPLIYLKILGLLFVVSVIISLITIFFILKDKKFLHFHFIRWIYAHYGAYYSAFLLFLIIFFPVTEKIKFIILIIMVLYFYFLYIKALIKIRRDLHIPTYYIILYLCTTELIPIGALFYNISYIL